MKLLVTGGAGFIGSAVVRLAIARGYFVINVDALTYAACMSNLESVLYHPRYTFEHVDIRDRTGLHQVFAKHNPDAVMHLAANRMSIAQSTIPQYLLKLMLLVRLICLGCAWLLAGARKPKSFRFHHISTDEDFGSLGPTGMFTEVTPYDPRSPYSASKASSDHIVRAWHETYGLPVVLTNCSNNYGPYHFPEKLIPLVILNALAGKPLPIYGDGGNP